MNKLRHILRIVGPTVFWLAVWALLSLRVGSELLLPAPGAVLRRTAELAVTAAFRRSIAATLLRILGGALAGLALGTALAVLCCRFRLADALLAPLLSVIKSTPVVSFIILVLVWVGRDFVPVIIVVLMVLPVVWANVCAGIRATDPKLLEMARVYRLSPGRTLTKIRIPSVLPHFLAACRSVLGLAWKAGTAAEVLTVPTHSLGRMLYESKLYLETTDLFAWTLVIVVCSLIIEKLLVALLRLPERRRKEASA